jgi:hypothetical protein
VLVGEGKAILTATVDHTYSSAQAGAGTEFIGKRLFAISSQRPLFLRGDFTMGQQANTGKSTKQQPAGKGQPQPKKGK